MTYRQKNFLCICSLVLLAVFSSHKATAKSLTVAVAANFSPALEKISKLFTRKTGIVINTTVSSSGRLYAQIRNRAPFDLFFSADRKRPDMLFRDGYCEKPVEYVKGRVVLWCRNPRFCEKHRTWQTAVLAPGLKKIGMANPELAPYGASTKEALVQEKIWPALQSRLVFGTNVGQSFQYAGTGVTGASFIALSLAGTAPGKSGCFLPVPEAKPVSQGACIIGKTENMDGARQFLKFMRSEEAQVILQQYGYQ